MSRADGNIFVMRNGKGVPHFVQSDSRWGSRTLGTGSSISAQGCAISCIAMFLKFYGRDVTPGTLDEYLDTHQGYVGNSVVFATALKCGEAESLMISYGGKLTVNFDSIISQRIGNNMPTVARVDYGTDADENYNHFVVIVGITSDGDYIINDPGTRLGNGAENPNNDNIISKTTRKNGYKLVAVDIFDVTDTNTQPDVAPSDPIPVSQFIPPNSRTVTVKTFTLPVKLSSGTEISSESLNEYLNHTEKQYKGGYFPLGANTVWHGGLHIHAAQGSNVYAMADGEIVAAKLAETPEKANGYYGSHNFILVKHTITGAALNKQFANTQNKMDEGADQQRDQKNNNSFNSSENRSFYSLYMHLNMETLDLTNQKLNEVSWLQKRDNQQVPENTETYVVLPGDTIEKIARQWNTTVEEVRVNNPNLESHYGKNSTGTISWYHAGDIIRRPQSKIAETVINDEIIAALKSGEIVKINNVNVKAGDLLWTSGLYGTPPSGMIHWEVFSEENLLPSFTPVEDPDSDCNMDSKVIFDMVEQGNNLFNDKSNLDASEVINFYSTSQKANLLRRYSCRFLSEWAMNLDVAIPRMKGRFTTIGLKGRLSPYIWWSDAVSKGVDLPANRHVWHYNPVAFIEALHALSNISNPGITPVQNAAVCSSADVKFYIVRPTGEQEASGHGDLSDEDISCKREIMVCEKNNGTEKKWKIGIAATLQNCRGLGFTGNTRLKKALIDGGVEGIPEITERRKRIWASIWWSEGCLEAINQYDSAFLSFGPIQQTIGTGGGKGELSAALAYVKNENPEIFNKYFGQYGLDAVEVSKAAYGVEYAYLKLNGILVNKTDLKNEFRKFIWGYRCVKAMNDPVFRKLFLAYGFKRIELVENMQKTIGSTTVVFKDVFKSELAHALALDAHINLPAKVDSSSGDGIWVKALKAVKGTASGGVDISTITQNDEYEMIKKLLFYRQKCGMWSPCARAAMIILCCKDLSDTLVKSLGYSGLYELYTDADLTSSKAQKYKYNFLQTTRESYV